MPSLTDERFKALRGQGYTGATNDMLVRWLRDAAFPAGAGLNGLPGNGYLFDGTTMYATIPDWKPLGLPFTVSASVIPLSVDLTEQRIIASTGNSRPRMRVSATNAVQWTYDDLAGSATPLSPFNAVQDETYNLMAIHGGDGVLFEGESDPAIARTVTANAITTFGAANAGADNFFHGPIWGVHLTDNAPLQDRFVCIGNDNRYVLLSEPIVIPVGGDAEISFDWIRQDRTGTGTFRVMGSTDGDDRIELFDSGSANPHEVRVRLGGGLRAAWPLALSDVAQGQHCNIRITRTGNDNELFVDGVSKGVKVGGVGQNIRIDEIAAAGGSGNALGPNAALGNVRIKDIADNREWFYPLDEGSGTIARNEGYRGSHYGGVWTPAANWFTVKNNSRHYPMTDIASDGTFKDVIGGNDGVINNFNAANVIPGLATPDLWRRMLDAKLVQPTTGHRNEDWFNLLGELGHTGALNDRELAFWTAGGNLP